MSAPAGQRGFLLFWPFLVFASSQILQNSLVKKEAEHMLSLFLPWPFLVRTREKSKRLKRNKRERGRMIICLRWGQRLWSELLTGFNTGPIVPARERHRCSPPSTPAPCAGKSPALCQGVPVPETAPTCCLVRWPGMGFCSRLVQRSLELPEPSRGGSRKAPPSPCSCGSPVSSAVLGEPVPRAERVARAGG